MQDGKNISTLLCGAFEIAKTKYHAQHVSWTSLSYLLAGRFSLLAAVPNLQRQGDLDLLLRCMEDECEANKALETSDTRRLFLPFHYQVMLSEAWIIGCYEILRAFRQRDNEKKLSDDSVSNLTTFKSLLSDLERLRMPITKYEIAKDRGIKEPLKMQRLPPLEDVDNDYVYDRDDPRRSYVMPIKVSPRGSLMWLTIDHSGPSEKWIERRDLADRLLSLNAEVIPAGVLEASRSGGGIGGG